MIRNVSAGEAGSIGMGVLTIFLFVSYLIVKILVLRTED